MAGVKYTPRLLSNLREIATQHADECVEDYVEKTPGFRKSLHRKYFEYKFAELLAKEAIATSKVYAKKHHVDF